MNRRGLGLAAVLAGIFAGCVESNSEMCSDGFVCPKGNTCRLITRTDGMTVDYCATDDQLGECGDELAPCGEGGSCHDGVCIPSLCGNMLQDVGEACDLGDTLPGNGCSADCLSNETCGNGIVDPFAGEDCDDGANTLTAHDGCSSVCQAETLTWKNIHYGWREGAAITWDGTRGRIVLFGGSRAPIDPGAYYADEVSGETWELEDGRWELRDVISSPAPRIHHLMAYDEERRQVVMFGGEFLVGSTWTLDAGGWHDHTSATAPLVSPFQSMAYDPVRKYVLFYGDGMAMGNFVPRETWAWDGTAWTLLSSVGAFDTPQPPPTGGGMAFDRKRGVMVLQAGDSTWEHDGTTWSKSSVTPPTFVFGDPALAYDPTDQRMIVVGGGDPSMGNRKTWAFDGTTWTPLPDLPTVATEVRDVTMATDEVSGRVVLIAQRQTLTFTGTAWKVLQTEAAPPPLYRLYAAIALDASHREIVMFGGQNSDILNETWLWKGYWEKQTGTMPSKRVQPALAYDPVRDEVVMLGGAVGRTDQPGIDDMWIWKNHTWSTVNVVRPPKRQGGAMAFDTKRGEMVLFGGYDMNSGTATLLSDTWTWNGTQWTPKTVASPPPARTNAAMGYDPVRDRIVMFGGAGATTGANLDDTWEWDGTTWTMAPRGPQPRESGSLVWNSAAKQLLLVGGLFVPYGDDYSTEVWSFDGTWHLLPSAPTPDPSPYVTPTIDGTGVAVFTSSTGYNGMVGDEIDTVWRLRWESGEADEACGQSDTDGDGAIGCADPDCAYMCPP